MGTYQRIVSRARAWLARARARSRRGDLEGIPEYLGASRQRARKRQRCAQRQCRVDGNQTQVEGV